MYGRALRFVLPTIASPSEVQLRLHGLDEQRLKHHVRDFSPCPGRAVPTRQSQSLGVPLSAKISGGSRTLPNFDVVDSVLVARVRTPGITPKFAVTLTGPFQIIGIESPHLYQLQSIETGDMQTVHVVRLRFYWNGQFHVTVDLEGVCHHFRAQGRCAIATVVNATEA